MKIIYKYPVPSGGVDTADYFRVMTPRGAFKPICVQMQNGQPQLWAEISMGVTENGAGFPLEIQRTVHIFGTGHFIPSHLTYAGTFQQLGGGLIFHVYVDCRNPN
jgi:hypothetical protein